MAQQKTNSKLTSKNSKLNNKDIQTNIIEKKIEKSEGLDSSVNSVITKTRTPQVIIKSEHINKNTYEQKTTNYELLKSICLCIMGIIVLITFFLSLKTYQIISQGLIN